MDFLKKVAGGVSKGFSWLGKNIVAPTTDFLKQVPGIKGVVNAIDPRGKFLQKSADFSATFYDVKADKKLLPTTDEIGSAISAIPKTALAAKNISNPALFLKTAAMDLVT